MGYNIHVLKKNVRIKKENFKDIAKEIWKVVSKQRLSWTDSDVLLRECSTANIEAIFEELMWPIANYDNCGNIINLEYDAPDKKLGDECIWMDAIAPFIESGSFIEILGEDGEMWRWVFNDGKMKEIYPKISWEP